MSSRIPGAFVSPRVPSGHRCAPLEGLLPARLRSSSSARHRLGASVANPIASIRVARGSRDRVRPVIAIDMHAPPIVLQAAPEGSGRSWNFGLAVFAFVLFVYNKHQPHSSGRPAEVGRERVQQSSRAMRVEEARRKKGLKRATLVISPRLWTTPGITAESGHNRSISLRACLRPTPAEIALVLVELGEGWPGIDQFGVGVGRFGPHVGQVRPRVDPICRDFDPCIGDFDRSWPDTRQVWF